MIRTCIGCRERAQKIALARIVSVRVGNSWELSVDQAGTRLGRGAYVHPTEQCFKAAIARKAFGRALRIEGRIETEGLEAWLQHVWPKKHDQVESP